MEPYKSSIGKKYLQGKSHGFWNVLQKF